jgi:cytochrome P450
VADPGFFHLLLVGGQETPMSRINNAILCLVENPAQLARLRAAPERPPMAIGVSLPERADAARPFSA